MLSRYLVFLIVIIILITILIYYVNKIRIEISNLKKEINSNNQKLQFQLNFLVEFEKQRKDKFKMIKIIKKQIIY